MKLLISFLLIIPFVTHFSISKSIACFCMQQGTAVEEFEKRSYEFSGNIFNLSDPINHLSSEEISMTLPITIFAFVVLIIVSTSYLIVKRNIGK